MASGITFKIADGDKVGTQFKKRVRNFSDRQIKAIQSCADRAKDDILVEGRANIAAGGNFSSARWQEGLQVKKSYRSRSDISLRVTHAVFFWRVFEYGARIVGRPMLWIPLGFAREAKGVLARDFHEPLFRVDRAGKAPLLLSKSGPKYFGKESVYVPKKWQLKRVIYNVSRRMNRYYKEAMRNGR